jgi:hypothetical protein
LLSKDGEARCQSLNRLADRVALRREVGREAVQRLDRLDDVRLLRVQTTDESVQLVQRGLRLRLSAGEGLDHLLVDRLQLRQAAAVEQEAKRREDFLNLGAAPRAVEWDGVAVAECPLWTFADRIGQCHELLPEQARLSDCRVGVVGQADLLVDPQPHDRHESMQ